jgi:hypothetical protein
MAFFLRDFCNFYSNEDDGHKYQIDSSFLTFLNVENFDSTCGDRIYITVVEKDDTTSLLLLKRNKVSQNEVNLSLNFLCDQQLFFTTLNTLMSTPYPQENSDE